MPSAIEFGVSATPHLPRGECAAQALEAELRRTGKRLDVLATGDTATDLRAVLPWSYRHLDNAPGRGIQQERCPPDAAPGWLRDDPQIAGDYVG
jgi:hypothetical protein